MKQTHGFRKEAKRRVETNSETVDETFDETDNKQKEKDDLRPVISTENRIVTLAPPISFTSLKVKLCHCHCRCPQSGWGWQVPSE
jgi:hypothetical protein